MSNRVALALLFGSLIACSSKRVQLAAPVAPPGRLLGSSGDRVVYLAHVNSQNPEVGDVRSVRADGTGEVALGGGEGRDLFHGIDSGHVFLSIDGAAPEVRSVTFDGSVLQSRAGSVGLLFFHGKVVAARGTGFELLDADMNATPLQRETLGDGRTLTAGGSYATLSAVLQ